jgi:hypothetical protein
MPVLISEHVFAVIEETNNVESVLFKDTIDLFEPVQRKRSMLQFTSGRS